MPGGRGGGDLRPKSSFANECGLFVPYTVCYCYLDIHVLVYTTDTRRSFVQFNRDFSVSIAHVLTIRILEREILSHAFANFSGNKLYSLERAASRKINLQNQRTATVLCDEPVVGAKSWNAPRTAIPAVIQPQIF